MGKPRPHKAIENEGKNKEREVLLQDNYTLVEELLYGQIFALQKSSNKITIAACGECMLRNTLSDVYRRTSTNRLHQGVCRTIRLDRRWGSNTHPSRVVGCSSNPAYGGTRTEKIKFKVNDLSLYLCIIPYCITTLYHSFGLIIVTGVR